MIMSKWIGTLKFQHKDAAGQVIWEGVSHNDLADEGEHAFLDVFLRGGAAPTTFFLRLFNDTPVETDSLDDIQNEPSGDGYAAQEVERSNTGWPTLALDDGDYQAESKTVTFTADGGAIGPVSHCVLATTSNNTGLHIAFAALSEARTMQDGESLDVSYDVKLA